MIFNKNERYLLQNYASYIAIAIQNVIHFREKGIKDTSTALSEIAGAVAHKMKNDLATIMLYQENLIKNYNTNDPKYSYLSESIDIINELTNDITYLLNISKLGIKKKTMINIELMLERFQRNYAFKFKTRDIIFILKIEKNLPKVLIDRKQIYLVLADLSGNSIDAINKNGRITVSVFRKGNELYIEWSNNGPVINPKIAKKIFDLGFTTKSKGYGLGLFHCKVILEAHGGSITLDLNYKDGVKFIMRLPLSNY